MARVGQIIYNLQDYQQSGGRISTSGANVFATIVDTDTGYDPSKRINIYENVVSHYDGQRFSKLGIQAAPGTQFILNGTKGMIVGRNGIYELDDIVITELSFVRPRNYVLDSVATQMKLDAGIAALTDAENTRAAALKNLDDRHELKDILAREAELSNDGLKYIYPEEIYTNWKDKCPQFFMTYSDNGDGTFSVDKAVIDSELVQFEKDYWTDYTTIQSTYQETYESANDDLILGLNGVYKIDNTTTGDLENVIIDFLY